jgi:hypothetical protein
MQDFVTGGTVFVETWRVELLPVRNAPTHRRAPRRGSKAGSDLLLDDRGASKARAIALGGDPAQRRLGFGAEDLRCLTGRVETLYPPAAACERRAGEYSKAIARSPMWRGLRD